MAASVLAPQARGASTTEPAAQPSLRVLHWWTSVSERMAADVLARRLGEQGVHWQDEAIPGGAGIGASMVLRSRVLAGSAPEATQIIGTSIRDWAGLGLLLEFDTVGREGHWERVLLPTVYDIVRYHDHVVAAPLGIHRVNSLFYNRRLFARLGIDPPTNWEQFAAAAQRFKATGVRALAQSSEAWQVTSLFESLVLAQGGAPLHRALFVEHDAAAAADSRVREALEHLRAIKAWAPEPPEELPWTTLVGQLANGGAAMLVMGDWAKGELNAIGAVTDTDFSCEPVPGTQDFHLYSVDTLTMFATDYSHVAAQEKLARLTVAPGLQAEYNRIKGSVPVRADTDPARLDSCARASWIAFARHPQGQVPSLVHRMATDDASKNAIIGEIHRYFVDDGLSPADTQRRLAEIFRALHLQGAEGP